MRRLWLGSSKALDSDGQEKKIKWEMLSELFYGLVKVSEAHRTTLHNLKVYAIDGKQVNLPRSNDLLDKGFTGFQLEGGFETHTLKGYCSGCFDVLTGVMHAITFSNTLNEHRDRKKLVSSVKGPAVIVYDRLYFIRNLLEQHESLSQTYFIARCKSNSSKEAKELFENKETSIVRKRYLKRQISYIKFTPPKSNEECVFATDLPESLAHEKLITDIYGSRWWIETSFFDQFATLKQEQWHSKSLNGILQELFCSLYLMTLTRLLMLLAGEKSRDPTKREYTKANFKLCFNLVVRNFKLVITQPRKLLNRLIKTVQHTAEKRVQYKRSNPRVIKGPSSKYKRDSIKAVSENYGAYNLFGIGPPKLV